MVSLNLFLRDFSIFAGMPGLAALLFIFLGALVEGVGLVLLIPFFSVIIEAQTSSDWMHTASARLFALFSAESRFAKLILLLTLFAILMVLRAAIITARDVILAKLQIGFIQHIRSRITRRLAAAQWDTVSRLRHSRITHVMGADIQQLAGATYMLLRDVVAIVMLISQILLAFVLAPFLAGLALAVVLLGAAILLPMVKRARAIGNFVTNANLSLIDDMTQFLGALKLAISQNLQESFTRQFEAILTEVRAQQIRYVLQQTLTGLAITTLSGLVGAVAILFGILIFEISAATLITLLLILSRMSGPAMQLQLDAQQFAHAVPAYEQIRTLENDLAAAEAMAGDSCDSASLTGDGAIVFRRVTYLHNATAASSGAAGGVRDLDLLVEPGSIIGITGPSGAGKTTFADLLVGLYTPQSGKLIIDDIVLQGAVVRQWRNFVSYVTQDPFLFHDTIRHNLLWARPDADEAALWDVLRIAGAEEIVLSASQGLDTIVGERGGLLSGGERQRLSIARALLRRPKLLVLDEATSAIDLEGEQMLLTRLLQTRPCPTIVMIAHRLESLRHCQRVIVFEGGKLTADGPSGIVLASLHHTLHLHRHTDSVEPSDGTGIEVIAAQSTVS